MQTVFRWFMLYGVILLTCVVTSHAYSYPFTDPYVATGINTPAEYADALLEKVPARVGTIEMFPDREIPDILWNLSELRYSYVRQRGAAPLVFLVAGTGASFHSPKMQVMQKAFFRAGYHVVSLSSPTHPDFIVAASNSGIPGHPGTVCNQQHHRHCRALGPGHQNRDAGAVGGLWSDHRPLQCWPRPLHRLAGLRAIQPA